MNVTTVARFIKRLGQTATLRRITGPQRYISVTLKAVMHRYRPEDMAEGVIQGNRQIRISNEEIIDRKWPGPPRRGDQVIIAGRIYTVEGVDSPQVSADIALHVLDVKGSS